MPSAEAWSFLRTLWWKTIQPWTPGSLKVQRSIQDLVKVGPTLSKECNFDLNNNSGVKFGDVHQWTCLFLLGAQGYETVRRQSLEQWDLWTHTVTKTETLRRQGFWWHTLCAPYTHDRPVRAQCLQMVTHKVPWIHPWAFASWPLDLLICLVAHCPFCALFAVSGHGLTKRSVRTWRSVFKSFWSWCLISWWLRSWFYQQTKRSSYWSFNGLPLCVAGAHAFRPTSSLWLQIWTSGLVLGQCEMKLGLCLYLTGPFTHSGLRFLCVQPWATKLCHDCRRCVVCRAEICVLPRTRTLPGPRPLLLKCL